MYDIYCQFYYGSHEVERFSVLFYLHIYTIFYEDSMKHLSGMVLAFVYIRTNILMVPFGLASFSSYFQFIGARFILLFLPRGL
jgi:hypothetical protein